MAMNRRHFVKASLGAGMLALAPEARGAASPSGEPSLRLDRVSRSPLKIASVELLRSGAQHFVRSTTSDGAFVGLQPLIEVEFAAQTIGPVCGGGR